MTELNPCPFCGSDVKICTAEEAYSWIDNSQGSPEYKDQYVVTHIDHAIQREHDCIWAGDFVIWASSINNAIVKWNRRVKE